MRRPGVPLRLIYTLLWYFALPFVFLRMVWRGRRNAGYWQRWGERLGLLAPMRTTQSPIWVHAVSVGETVAAAPLIQALLHSYPDRALLVTSTTPTGSDRVNKLFGSRVRHAYVPFDLPDAVARFLRRSRPAVGIIMETEIWPNLFHACAKRGIPLILANARLSARSAKGYRRAGRIIRDSLDAVVAVAAQSPVDAERFRTLVLDPERVVVAGNLKYEIELPTDLRRQARALRAELGQAPLWLAASTHEGEERLVLDAFFAARRDSPALRLVLVPRHPERFNVVAELCADRGLRVARRSQGWPKATEADVLLGDTMGELLLFYGLADLAFIGGSLVPVGGHNILEAAAMNCPIILGPHTFNMEGMREAFAEAIVSVSDVAGLADAVTRLLASPGERERLAARGRELLEAHRGSTAALQRLIERTLSGPSQRNPAESFRSGR